MRRDEIQSKVIEILATVTQTDLPGDDFAREAGLLEQLHIDSLMALEIIVQIEQVFHVAIEDDDFVFSILDSIHKTVDFLVESGSQLEASR